MFTGSKTLKWRNILKRPYASICVDCREPPYASVIMDGPVEEVSRSLYELLLEMALRYYGEEKRRAFAEGYNDNPMAAVAFNLVPRYSASFDSDES
jgi:hypothetical protein